MTRDVIFACMLPYCLNGQELINMFIVHCSECVHCFLLWNPSSPKSCGNVYAKWWRMHLKCGVCALSSPLITFGRQCHYTHNTWTCPSPDQPLWSSLYPQHMIWFVNPHRLWPALTKPFDLQRMVCCAWWAKVYHLTRTSKSTRPADHFTILGKVLLATNYYLGWCTHSDLRLNLLWMCCVELTSSPKQHFDGYNQNILTVTPQYLKQDKKVQHFPWNIGPPNLFPFAPMSFFSLL